MIQLRAASVLAAALAVPQMTRAASLTFQTAKEKTGQAVDFRFVSRNGKGLAGTTVAGGKAVAYHYAAGTGLSLLSNGVPLGNSGAWAMDLSADGRTVIGHAGFGYYPAPTSTEGFVWSPPAGYLGIGNLSKTSASIAMRFSNDGSTVIGQSQDQGSTSCFFWDSKTGIQACSTRFPDFPVDLIQPVHVSNDARTVWGNGYDNGYRAICWRHGAPPLRFTDLPGGNNSVSVAVTPADAKLAFGSASTENGYVAVQFDETGGTTPLFASQTFQSMANAVTTDGRMVAGYVDHNLSRSSMSATDSFILDRKTGRTTFLSEFLAKYVPSAAGWKGITLLDMSGNGNVMIGEGIDPDGNYTSWILEGARNYLIPMDEPLVVHAGKRMHLNRQTGLYEQSVTVKNRSPFEISGFEIQISGLPDRVELEGSIRRKDSVRVIRVEHAVAPETSLERQLKYHNPKRDETIHPTVKVLAFPSEPS